MSTIRPVPPAIRSFLRTPTVARSVQHLQRPSTARFVHRVALDYACIATAIVVASASYNSAAFVVLLPLALLVIAARQHALLILMHDATHFLASPNRRANDWLGELLCAAPMFVTMANYRANHLAHHQHLNSAADPDWRRKLDHAGERTTWLFPTQHQPAYLFVRLYRRSIGYLMNTLRETASAPASAEQRAACGIDPHQRGLILRTRTWLYLGLAIVLTVTGTWGAFALYWLVPVFLILPMILRLRSIAEHFALQHSHYLNESRNIEAGPIERFFVAPHHIGLHLTHHLVASVPVYRLQQLHALLLACDLYRQHAHHNDGYLWGKDTLLHDMYRVRSVRLPVAEALQHNPSVA